MQAWGKTQRSPATQGTIRQGPISPLDLPSKALSV
jgi:hypothetical protein